MRASFPRPPSVPEAAEYDPEYNAWAVASRDASGARHGLCRFYRADGGLFLEANFERGLQHGPFTLFHPNGRVARRGQYAQGELDGELVAYADASADALTLRACCVPEHAVELRSEYRHGDLVREAFFDATGAELPSEGPELPARPANVPLQAGYDAASERWVVRTTPDPLDHVDRYFTLAGHLSEELEYRGGALYARRRFDGEGRLLEACRFDENGALDGPYLRRFSNPGHNPYREPRLHEERGHYEAGSRVGTVTWFDSAGHPLRKLDCGERLTEDALESSPAFSAFSIDSSALFSSAAELAKAGRLREALCLAARAAARGLDPTELRTFLAQHTLPLKGEFARELGERLSASSDASVERALNDLLGGCEPALAYKTLAALLDSRPEVAIELIEAALLLNPELTLGYMTRALVRIQLGDADGALSDAERVRATSRGAAEFVLQSVRVHFPEFSFWPERESFEPLPRPLPELTPARSLDAIRRQIQVYAARFELIRQSLPPQSRARSAWPDLRALLPSGALDAQESLEVASATPGARSGQARAEWAALTWLCWSAGLDRVALPERIAPPKAFARAVSEMLARHVRAQDRVLTGGLGARLQGLPGFSWEGMDIDSMNPELVRVLLTELAAVKQMFIWLLFEDSDSPFGSTTGVFDLESDDTGQSA